MLTDCGADNPCKNDGNCTRNSSTVICECEPQYTGEYCQNLGKNKNVKYIIYNNMIILILVA